MWHRPHRAHGHWEGKLRSLFYQHYVIITVRGLYGSDENISTYCRGDLTDEEMVRFLKETETRPPQTRASRNAPLRSLQVSTHPRPTSRSNTQTIS